VTGKVIYVSFIRLTDKVARDWYIDYLIEKGVSVEYWDIVSLLREEHAEQGAIYPLYLRIFRTFSEVEEMLCRSEYRQASYVLLVSYVGRFTRIFRLLSQYDCRMLYIAWGAMPYQAGSIWQKLASAFAHPAASVKEIFYRTKALALRRLGLVKPFDIVFAAGQVLVATYQYAAKVVPINLCDYDQYVKARIRGGRLVPGRYAVFLDINLPYQSDLAVFGYPQIDPRSYYQSLNRFFGLLESALGIRVVIAAHPKTIYDAATFDGRERHRLVTAELVKDSEFVLSHTSTALGYAVLNAKPLVFIYTNQMLAAYANTVIRQMQCYADYLGAPIYNADAITEGHQLVIGSADLERYQRYKYSFLTTPQSENAMTADIFWRELAAQFRTA